MREKTTKKQRELLSYIETFIKQNNFSPSYREIMKAMGYKSVSTVANHIDNLIERGYIKKGKSGIRMLEIVSVSSELDKHKKWLKRILASKCKHLQSVNTSEAKQDLAAIERVSKLLSLEQYSYFLLL